LFLLPTVVDDAMVQGGAAVISDRTERALSMVVEEFLLSLETDDAALSVRELPPEAPRERIFTKAVLSCMDKHDRRRDDVVMLLSRLYRDQLMLPRHFEDGCVLVLLSFLRRKVCCSANWQRFVAARRILYLFEHLRELEVDVPFALRVVAHFVAVAVRERWVDRAFVELALAGLELEKAELVRRELPTPLPMPHGIVALPSPAATAPAAAANGTSKHRHD
jgi:hypothetical protein